MGTDITGLRRRKGTPPSADDADDVTADDARAGKPVLRPLQVRIPVDVFEDFSERAGREFGFSHGAKKRLFLKMWKAYKAQSI
ncbi:MAG: hypothetical protein OXQ29_08380 [Rhodospirillaceae bacterium]|nr:hypothetical protein [Rhodospirillaceae bacterium]